MAFLQDPARQPLLRVPSVVVVLIVLLIGIYALMVTAFASHANEIDVNYGLFPARYSHSFLVSTGANPGSLLDQALPFITYMFLHGSWGHVLINSVWLLAFGPAVARRFGTLLFLCFFLLCGVAGAVAHLAAYWGSMEPVIGASAAISGLMAAGFRMLPFGAQVTGTEPLTPLLSTQVLISTAVWCLINVFAGLTGFGAGPGVTVIAWVAHIGGFCAGLLLAGPFDWLARR